ncbi:hypothetical protein KCU85_g1758, partial [Aureobasidium melanogenum]
MALMDRGGLSDRAKGYIYGNDILMGLAFAVVATRFYCRMRLGSKRGLWWDDLFILLAFIFAVGFGAIVNVAMGHYGWDPLLLFYLWLIKDVPEKGLRRIIYLVMGLNATLCLVSILISIFRCSPISAAWKILDENAICLNEGVDITTVGALLTVMDFVVNILPLPIVARLNVAFQQRLAATVLLSLGTIATAAGIVREVYVYRAFVGSNDPTWGALPLWICADVEIYVGLLCACVPSLRPLWTKMTSWVSTKKTRYIPTNNSARHSRRDCMPPSMSWDEFDKDVIFDGTSSFHSASKMSKMFNGKKKSHTTSVATLIGKPHSQADSCLTSSNSDWEDVALKDLECGRPQEVHVRTSVRLQMQSF